jgi:tripartite-type tricarboxylate transporter receptor subunit TctC
MIDANIQKLYHDILKVLAVPDVRARLADVGLETVGNSPREFTAQVRDEIVKKG